MKLRKPLTLEGHDLTCADQHTIAMQIMMTVMYARTLPTQEERVAHLCRCEFVGPHKSGIIVIPRDVAEEFFA